MTGMIPKRAAKLVAAILAATAVVAVAAGTASANTIIYNNIPSPFPAGMNSMAFQATQTSEFGGQVQFEGATLVNPTVVVGMSSWACQTGTWNWPAEGSKCYTAAGAKFSEPVTLNIYEVGPGNAPKLPALKSVTQTFQMPYRPSASTKCKGAEAGKWFSVVGKECFNEKAFKITFKNLGVALPRKAIISVAYNTSNYGPEPIGPKPCDTESGGCPYDALNVAVRGSWEAEPRTPTVGSDPLPESDYIKSATAGNYCENPGGVGTFAISQNCWTEEQPAIEVTGSETPTAYVAIGDSLAFGYKEQTFNEHYPAEPASAFEGGYVADFAKKLATAEKKVHNALTTINLGCPGETSGGVTGAESPCAYQNVDGFPLKTELGGASELAYAVGLLGAGVKVTAVTINIGSNDELANIAKCENPEYLAEQKFRSMLACIETEVGPSGHEYAGGLFKHIITNVGTAIGTLRAYGYEGPVVVLGFYNPQALVLQGSDLLQGELNGAFEETITAGKLGPNVKYANPFPIFNPANETSKTREEKAVCKYTEECNASDIAFNDNRQKEKSETETHEGDIHPTELGYKKMGELVWKAF